MRYVSIVLGSNSISYSGRAVQSLLRNCLEPIHLRLITDAASDREKLQDMVATLDLHGQCVTVHAQVEADDLASRRFSGLPALQRFRFGHPCWRKLTDPSLFADVGAEVVVLDPDVYFPNRFTFDDPPDKGLRVMWQRPNCLLPAETVRAAFAAPARLADHVDIGSAHLKQELDWEYLDWFIERIGGRGLPRVPHVEAIGWSALAMRMGGGYLPPEHWHCWDHSHAKRLRLKFGSQPLKLLGAVPLDRIKMFHAGGIAKNWLVPAEEAGLFETGQTIEHCLRSPPFREFSRARFEILQLQKDAAKAIGYT